MNDERMCDSLGVMRRVKIILPLGEKLRRHMLIERGVSTDFDKKFREALSKTARDGGYTPRKRLNRSALSYFVEHSEVRLVKGEKIPERYVGDMSNDGTKINVFPGAHCNLCKIPFRQGDAVAFQGNNLVHNECPIETMTQRQLEKYKRDNQNAHGQAVYFDKDQSRDCDHMVFDAICGISIHITDSIFADTKCPKCHRQIIIIEGRRAVDLRGDQS